MLTLKLNTEEWSIDDFTSTSGNGISFTIYQEEKMVNVKNLTGYTLKMRLYDQDNIEVFSDDVNILSAVAGTGEYLPSQGKLTFGFIGEVEIELSKTNEVLTSKGNNGSAKLRIRKTYYSTAYYGGRYTNNYII